MMSVALDQFDKNGIESIKYDRIEKMDAFNKSFKTSLQPENGCYGITEIVKDNGLLERLSRNEQGHIRKDYFRDGKQYLRREKISDGNWLKTHFDDNGNDYLRENIVWGKNTPAEYNYSLKPSSVVEKGNFSCEIDSFGRPVRNRVTDIPSSNNGREHLTIKKDSSYRVTDERGHLIADRFGGPSSKENIVPQLKETNRETMKQLEDAISKFKQDNPDAKVDYEIKTNYADKGMRPSSFEPKVLVDGKPIELKQLGLDNSFKKIYNELDPNALDKLKTKAGETVDKVRTNVGPKNWASHEAGIESGKMAATITFTISTVDNVYSFVEGEKSAEEMVCDITKDTGTAAIIGYGSGFVTHAAAQALSESSHQVFRSLGNANAVGAAVSFGLDSYDSVIDFAQGNIDAQELAYDFGESGAGVAGSILGSAAAGAAVGSIVPGAGTIVGAGAGLVGGMVGYTVTTGAYASAVELGSEGAEVLADKAHEFASNTLDSVEKTVPDKVEDVKASMNQLAEKANLPFKL